MCVKNDSRYVDFSLHPPPCSVSVDFGCRFLFKWLNVNRGRSSVSVTKMVYFSSGVKQLPDEIWKLKTTKFGFWLRGAPWRSVMETGIKTQLQKGIKTAPEARLKILILLTSKRNKIRERKRDRVRRGWATKDTGKGK